MGFRDGFLWTNKTYAEWSLENATRDGFQGNQARLAALQRQVKSTFQQGIDRLAQSQSESSAALQGELAYQAERITDQISQGTRDVVSAVQQGSSNIVDSIQRMSDYLGSELCEIRWAMERQTEVSQQILETLLKSLSNESRQYFEQGVRCYETNEYNFAKERFSKALEADRTNYFAYQYLGFVSVVENNSKEAIRNFELARKFATKDYHRALALSHIARGKWASGDRSNAVEYAAAAARVHPRTAKFWYDLASYNASLGQTAEAISALSKAIEEHSTYWAVVSSDVDFDSIRADVNRLLNTLRETAKKKARQAIDNLKRATDTAEKVNAGSQLSGLPNMIGEFEEQYKKNNIFIYLELIPKAQDWHEKIFTIPEKSLDEQIREKQNELYKYQSEKDDQIKKLQNSVSSLESEKSQIPAFRWNGGCGAYIGTAFVVFFLGVCAMTNQRHSEQQIIYTLVFTVLSPLVILLVYNAVSYIFGSALPKAQISQQIDNRKNVAARNTTTLEDNFQKISETLNKSINELKNVKERCRARQYL